MSVSISTVDMLRLCRGRIPSLPLVETPLKTTELKDDYPRRTRRQSQLAVPVSPPYMSVPY